MRFSEYFIPTLKEVPSDASIASHRLMLRSGMIRQLTAGVYSYLPLGLRVFKKIENIIREEMNAIGGIEFSLPALSPVELWKETGRLEAYGDDIFKIKNRDLVLAPTHEEVFTSIARSNLVSYKNLPQMWYQIQTKFRNEPRPRGGVLRGRQFVMKDAYSFDASWEGLDESYKKQAQAYRNIFTRCGLNFFTVTAFSGAMGGSDSEEFMVETEAGEDSVVLSEDGKYASNLEVAESYVDKVQRINSNFQPEEFYTPNIKTIDELADFLKIKDKTRLAKSRVYVSADTEGKENFVLVLLCGDDDVNESKLQTILGSALRPAHPEELLAITGADAGSIGPIGLKTNLKIIADLRLENADELISGANKNDYHHRNIDLDRDAPGITYEDIRVVKENELSKDKSSKIRITRAIETGHIFKLGTKYAESLGAKFLDSDGTEKVIIMGSYGIGIERIAAAFIEQNHDENGIKWNKALAPFKIVLISVNSKSEEVSKIADKVYSDMIKEGYDVLYDDREDVSPGVKFKDADLIGIPLQVVISERNLKTGSVEIKIRKTGEKSKENLEGIVKAIPNYLKNV